MSRALRMLCLSATCGILLTSCLQVRWSRVEVATPVTEESYAGLAPGHALLSDALEALGAPTLVRELPSNGIACAWAWKRGRNWGLTLQVPVTGDAGVSFDFDDAAETLDGIVMFFDGDLELMAVERGKLRTLLPKGPPPTLVISEEPLPDLLKPEDMPGR